MLGFQHAADVLLLEQQCLRHSRFARMHMLFLDAGGAAGRVVVLRRQQRAMRRDFVGWPVRRCGCMRASPRWSSGRGTSWRGWTHRCVAVPMLQELPAARCRGAGWVQVLAVATTSGIPGADNAARAAVRGRGRVQALLGRALGGVFRVALRVLRTWALADHSTQARGAHLTRLVRRVGCKRHINEARKTS